MRWLNQVKVRGLTQELFNKTKSVNGSTNRLFKSNPVNNKKEIEFLEVVALRYKWEFERI